MRPRLSLVQSRSHTQQSSRRRRVVRFVVPFLVLSSFGIFGTKNFLFRILIGDGTSRTLLLDQYTSTDADSPADKVIPSTAAPDNNKDSIDKNDNTVVHVLYGLSGNQSGFLKEFEISLKSVLLNAPIDHDLTIHVIADELASQELPNIFVNTTQIDTWHTRNKITIQVYTILPTKLKVWERTINEKYDTQTARDSSSDDNDNNAHHAWGKHTIGCYFRLFIHDVLQESLLLSSSSRNSNKKNKNDGNEVAVVDRNLTIQDGANDINHIIYLDVDVIMMSNLDDIWYHRNPDTVFQWGEKQSSGFIILNTHKLQHLWDSINSTTVDMYSKVWNTHERPGDQLLLRVYNVTYPQNVGRIPKEYDVPLAHNLWKANSLRKYRSDGVGNLHFSGSPNPKQSVYETHEIFKNPKHQSGWGLANYYIHLPWSYAKFIASSLINKKNVVQQQQPPRENENGKQKKRQQHQYIEGDRSDEESSFGYPLKINYNTIG